MPKGLSVEEFMNLAPKPSKGLSPEEFMNLAPAQPQEPLTGFQARMAEDYAKRKQQVATAEALEPTNKTALLKPYEVVAANLGLVGDTIGNVIGSGARYAGDLAAGAASLILPDEVSIGLAKAAGYGGEAAKNTAGEVLNDSLLARGVKSGVEGYKRFAQENPEMARYIDATGTIAVNAPLLKPVAAGVKATSDIVGQGLQNVGGGIRKMGETQAMNRKMDFVKELVMPKETKKVLESQVGRTTEKGLLGRKVVEPTPIEAASIEEVSKIKGIKKGNSANTNYNIINSAKNREASILEGNLQKSDVVYNPADVNNRLNTTLENLRKEPMIVGDGETTAARVVEKMNELVAGKNTPAGLLQARREFDDWARSKKKSVFADDTALSESVSATRQTINDFIADSVPDAAVKESLRKQSLLYRALDNIQTKAATEGKTKLHRAAKKASDAIPIVNPITKGVVTSAGLAGIGTGAALAPILAAGGLAAYGAGRVITSPITKKAIGTLIEGTGKIMRGGKELTPKEIKTLAPAEINEIMRIKKELKNTK